MKKLNHFLIKNPNIRTISSNTAKQKKGGRREAEAAASPTSMALILGMPSDGSHSHMRINGVEYCFDW